MARDRGFSLVDAAVTVGVAGVLGGLLLPLVLKPVQEARIARARHDLNLIAAAYARVLAELRRKSLYTKAHQEGTD